MLFVACLVAVGAGVCFAWCCRLWFAIGDVVVPVVADTLSLDVVVDVVLVAVDTSVIFLLL